MFNVDHVVNLNNYMEGKCVIAFPFFIIQVINLKIGRKIVLDMI